MHLSKYEVIGLKTCSPKVRETGVLSALLITDKGKVEQYSEWNSDLTYTMV